jgi:predicted Zn-dependent protease
MRRTAAPRLAALLCAAAAALSLPLSGCAVNPVTGKSELSLVAVTEPEEIDMGRKAFGPAVQQQGGLYRDPEMQRYVQELGMRVAKASHRPALPYRFEVLNSSVPNAFALPGGSIVVNRGLLVALSNESEAAAVLAHEVGHVTARHSVAMYQRSIGTSLVLQGISVATGGKELVVGASAITAELLSNGFSREQEREADALGTDYLAGAGYDPNGMVQLQEYFFRELEGGRNPLFVEGLFRTHPFSKERLENTRALVAKKYSDPQKRWPLGLNPTVYAQKTLKLREVQKAYDLADAGDKAFAGKKYDEALSKYREAAAKEPRQAPFHAAIGRALLAMGNGKEAEGALRKAVALDDEMYEPHLLLGSILQANRDPKGAIAELNRSMELLPTKAGANLLSRAYTDTGDAANAKKFADLGK